MTEGKSGLSRLQSQTEMLVPVDVTTRVKQGHFFIEVLGEEGMNCFGLLLRVSKRTKINRISTTPIEK